MGEILALMSAFCFGLGSVVAKKALSDTNRELGLLITVLINAAISSVALAIYLPITGNYKINIAGTLYFLMAGIFSSFLGRMLLFKGIEIIGSARTSGLRLSAPLFSIFIGVFVLNENLTSLKFAGIFMVLCGLTLLALETIKKSEIGTSDKTEKDTPRDKNNIQGIIWGILAGTSFGAAIIFRKLGIQIFPNAFWGIWITINASLLSLLIYQFIKQKGLYLNHLYISLIQNVNIYYIFFAFLTSLAQFFLILSLKYIGAGVANTLGATEGLFATILSYIILKNKEKITLHTFTSILIVTVGVSIIILF